MDNRAKALVRVDSTASDELEGGPGNATNMGAATSAAHWHKAHEHYGACVWLMLIALAPNRG